MFSLYFKQDDTVEIDGKTYDLNISFDNVLKIIELMKEERIANDKKVEMAIRLFFRFDSRQHIPFDFETQYNAFLSIFEEYVKQEEKTQEYDIKGNPMPVYKKDTKQYYSLKYDAEYIYASFMQAYGIDLLEQQGKLHWFKFQALLSGLPKDTKFCEVVSIRQWKKPNKGDTEEKQMSKLQEHYRLPDEDVGEEE